MLIKVKNLQQHTGTLHAADGDSVSIPAGHVAVIEEKFDWQIPLGLFRVVERVPGTGKVYRDQNAAAPIVHRAGAVAPPVVAPRPAPVETDRTNLVDATAAPDAEEPASGTSDELTHV